MLLLRRLTVQRTGPDDAPADTPPEPDVFARRTTEVEFAAYAEDCRLFGFYQVAVDRLTDALSESDTYDLKDVLVVRLDTALGTQARSLTVRRDEPLAVRALPRTPGSDSLRSPASTTFDRRMIVYGSRYCAHAPFAKYFDAGFRKPNGERGAHAVDGTGALERRAGRAEPGEWKSLPAARP